MRKRLLCCDPQRAVTNPTNAEGSWDHKDQKLIFFKCSDKNEAFYLQKISFSDREKFPESFRLQAQ